MDEEDINDPEKISEKVGLPVGKVIFFDPFEYISNEHTYAFTWYFVTMFRSGFRNDGYC